MEQTCFYCNNEIESSTYHGAFIHENQHVEKALCGGCYRDWLEGIKG